VIYQYDIDHELTILYQYDIGTELGHFTQFSTHWKYPVFSNFLQLSC